jgi:hypothetical protein
VYDFWATHCLRMFIKSARVQRGGCQMRLSKTLIGNGLYGVALPRRMRATGTLGKIALRAGSVPLSAVFETQTASSGVPSS